MGHLERKRFHGSRQIDTDHGCIKMESYGREVQNSVYACRHQTFGDRLGSTVGYCYQRQLDVLTADVVLQCLHWMHRNAVEHLAGDGFILIEGCQYVEASLRELGIGQQGSSDVSSAHDDRSPVVVEAENLSQCGDEIDGVVSDAGPADLSEMAEILSNLRRRDIEFLAQLSGTDGQGTRFDQPLDFTKVQAQSLDGGAWYFISFDHDS